MDQGERAMTPSEALEIVGHSLLDQGLVFAGDLGEAMDTLRGVTCAAESLKEAQEATANLQGENARLGAIAIQIAAYKGRIENLRLALLSLSGWCAIIDTKSQAECEAGLITMLEIIEAALAE